MVLVSSTTQLCQKVIVSNPWRDISITSIERAHRVRYTKKHTICTMIN